MTEKVEPLVPSASARQVYIIYKQAHLRYAFRINIDCGRDHAGHNIVNRYSCVIGSITEVGGPDHMTPFMGSAPMNLGSIAPMDNGTVDVSGYVDWETPLTFWISLVIFQ
jgi:hypothetical protein